MKVLVYSVKDAEEKGTGWVRGGENITYQINEIVRVLDLELKIIYFLGQFS
jgi:hypothetical protein